MPHRRPVMVRAVLLFALAMVLSALMPRWITHSHDGAHTAVHAIAADAAADHQHADSAGEPVVPLPDGSHVHVHYLAGAAATLPQVVVALCAPVQADACTPWQDASAPDGSLTRLHRPPIV
ncbi:hypothetical protein [Rhodanobacter thiooxydans]|nr:hypothetical protein [Rhodanobacter thiooxydans]